MKKKDKKRVKKCKKPLDKLLEVTYNIYRRREIKRAEDVKNEERRKNKGRRSNEGRKKQHKGSRGRTPI